MATAEATREFSKETKDLGDKIVGLTLKAAKELSDYLDVGKIRREWGDLMERQPKQGALPLWRLLNVAMWADKTRKKQDACLRKSIC